MRLIAAREEHTAATAFQENRDRDTAAAHSLVPLGSGQTRAEDLDDGVAITSDQSQGMVHIGTGDGDSTIDVAQDEPGWVTITVNGESHRLAWRLAPGEEHRNRLRQGNDKTTVSPGFAVWLRLIDPELARAMAKASKNIRFTTTPEHYKPTPAVETHVNARDQHCPSLSAIEAQHSPGCHRKSRTELDHSNPFNHKNPSAGGQTIPQNIKRLCRHHHRAKTHGGWRDKQNPDGTITWTSPTGETYTTDPD